MLTKWAYLRTLQMSSTISIVELVLTSLTHVAQFKVCDLVVAGIITFLAHPNPFQYTLLAMCSCSSKNRSTCQAILATIHPYFQPLTVDLCPWKYGNLQSSDDVSRLMDVV